MHRDREGLLQDLKIGQAGPAYNDRARTVVRGVIRGSDRAPLPWRAKSSGFGAAVGPAPSAQVTNGSPRRTVSVRPMDRRRGGSDCRGTR